MELKLEGDKTVVLSAAEIAHETFQFGRTAYDQGWGRDGFHNQPLAFRIGWHSAALKNLALPYTEEEIRKALGS